MENLLPKIDELLEGSTTDIVMLSTAQLHWSSAVGVWSVAQCVGHVVMPLELYFEKMGPLLKQRERFQHPDTPYKASMFGRFLIKFVDPESTRKVKAPKMFVPRDSHPADRRQRFIDHHLQLKEYITSSQGCNLTRMRFPSPVSSLLRLNQGDALIIMTQHGIRHYQQMLRLTREAGLPSGWGRFVEFPEVLRRVPRIWAAAGGLSVCVRRFTGW